MHDESPVAASPGLKRLEEFTLADFEAVRLVLRGDSVIDWHRLNFRDRTEAEEFLGAHEFRLTDPRDTTRLEAIKTEAVTYLRRQFQYPIPRPIAEANVIDLLMQASGKGHRQMCACTILKCMHIIHHLDGRELLFVMPLSDQEVFHLVEEKVYRVVGQMLAAGFPVAEFVGGRKHKDSLCTKLLSKQETIAAQIFDKLRFRIVTQKADDILPVLRYLTKELVPFNYVVPGQSINSLVGLRQASAGSEALSAMLEKMQVGRDDDLTPSDNTFSASNYRVIHFVADLPVRLPESMLADASPTARELGAIGFVICEFQLVDVETDRNNELGDASHDAYKERQKRAVMRRLQLGTREMKLAGRKRPT